MMKLLKLACRIGLVAAGLGLTLLAPGLGASRLTAQTVQPLIAEYSEHGAGSFEVINSSLDPSIVILEAKSFTIAPDGTGLFHALDPSIHLDLSNTSLRLEPKQTARVFYKVTADNVPAWLCIYASFSTLKKNPGLNVRVMLPHTIYLYQKQSLNRASVTLSDVHYDPDKKQVVGELTNLSEMAGRAASVEVSGPHGSSSQGGFPLLPHQHRTLAIEWKSDQLPRDLAIDFPHFSLKEPVGQAME